MPNKAIIIIIFFLYVHYLVIIYRLCTIEFPMMAGSNTNKKKNTVAKWKENQS